MRPLAVFTIVQNELQHIPVWLKYYCGHVLTEDIYVLDHNTTGDAADVLVETCQAFGIKNLIAVNHDLAYDSYWLAWVTRDFQQFLLKSYEAVLFVAADELVISLTGQLIDRVHNHTPDGVWKPQGYEVVHDAAAEPTLNWQQNLLRQRKFYYPCQAYTKPVLARRPIYWAPGWTRASNVAKERAPDPELILLHLHKIDQESCLRAHRERAARSWKPEERLDGLFRHNLIDDPELLARWLPSNADNTSEYAKLLEIPTSLKEFF
jgi:hypothetical protein